MSKVTNNSNELWKTVMLTCFRKPLLETRFNSFKFFHWYLLVYTVCFVIYTFFHNCEQLFLCFTEFGGSSRRRVVPHFSSGIEKRAKRERAWKSPHTRKARRSGEREKWGLHTKPKLLTLHGRPILDCEVRIPFQINKAHPMGLLPLLSCYCSCHR